MGAMAPSPHWLPEDDFLLKNAVEAGASLESLAKGAIQFSQRYTVQELQDRWLSLLYDPVVSIEASDHMIVVERSGFTNQSRPNKLEGVKEIGCSSGKRKAESVRRSYYAMRKRISNDPFGLMGINLLSGPSNSNFGDGHDLPSAVQNDLGIQDQDFDIRDPYFSELGPHDESRGNVVQNHDQGLHLGGEDLSQSLPCPYVENVCLPGDQSEVHGFDQSKELPLCNLFETEGLQNEGNEFGGPAFRDFGCSSSLPQMAIWTESSEISASGLPIQIGEGNQQMGDAFMIPQAGNANEPEALRFDDLAPSTSNLETGLSSDSMIGVAPPAEDYFAELSNTLFDFTTEDELLFLDPDGNNTIDKAYFEGLSSLLLDSPKQNELPSVDVGEEADVMADGLLAVPSVAHLVESDSERPHLCDLKVPDAQVAFSVSTAKDLGPEYRNGVICCTLNTEDPEVPDNDDVFLPFRFPSPTKSSGAHWRLENPSYLASCSSKSRKTNGGPPTIKNNQRDSYQPPRVIGPSQSSDVGLKYPIGDRGVKLELPKSNIPHAVLRNPRTDHISSANASANAFIGQGVKVGATEMEGVKKNVDCVPSVDKHDRPEILQNHQNNASGSRNGLDVKAEFLENRLPDVDLRSQTAIVPQSNGKPSTSDEDEWSEKDFDVPYFSDVEAMILDMDLLPEEFDITTNPEVQRFQHEETKRTIIRLEQSANSCTQRAIAAQNAFAVLYGRQTKHFIKKPEVVLGRSTDESKVDIDFGREKDGGKISRRQAIIKLDTNGMFRLKNLGRCLIHVNGEEVAPGHILSLPSGCLIEVRGLSFVFETNDRSIKEFVDSVVDKSILLDPVKLEAETE